MYHEFINHAGCLFWLRRHPADAAIRGWAEKKRENLRCHRWGKGWEDFLPKAGQWIFIYLDPTGQSDNHSQLDFSRAMFLFSISCFSDSSLHCWCPLIMGSDDWRTWSALASEMRISPATEARVERPHSRRSSRILSSAWQLFTLRMYGFPIHWNDHFPL